MSGEYTLEIIDGDFIARLENGSFELNDLELVEKGKQDVLVAIPAFSMRGMTADLKEREIVVDRIQSTDAAIKSWLSADGSIELQRLFQADLQKLTAMKTSGAPEPDC